MARSFALRARGLRAHLRLAGHHRLLRQHGDARLACRQRPEGVLHDPILERVERDDHQPRPGAQPRRGRLQEAIELVQLAVHPDPQRLERPRGRIDPAAARARHGPPDDRRQLPASSRCGAARRGVHDGPRDPRASAAPRRNAKISVRQIVLRPRGRSGRPPFGPWLESIRMSSGSSRWKLNPRPGAVELQRRHAEVGQRAVDRVDAALRRAAAADRGSRRAPARRGRRQLASASPASASASRSRSSADHPRRARLEQRPRVPAQPDRAIHEEAAALGLPGTTRPRRSAPVRDGSWHGDPGRVQIPNPTARAHRRR